MEMVDLKEKKSTPTPDKAATAEMPAVAPADKAWSAGFAKKAEDSLAKNDLQSASTVSKSEKNIPAKPSSADAEQPYPKREGRLAMFLTNFLGLHWVANSTLSLFIAYNVVVMDPVQKFMGRLEKLAHPISKGWDVMMSPIRKGLESLGLKKIDYEFLNSTEEVRKAIHAERIMNGSRSFVETLCMCIAGSIILFPVKLLENHHTGFINSVDNFFHPEHKKQNDEEERRQKEAGHDKHNETWFNLIRARLVALVPIFWIDGLITNSTTKRFNEGKGNVDGWLWQKGAQLYDNDQTSKIVRVANRFLPENWTASVANFFAQKNITLSGIQPMQLPKILKTVGAPQEMHDAAQKILDLSNQKKFHLNNPEKINAITTEMKSISDSLLKNNPGLKSNVERAIFAEQTRMFAKEIYLTGLYTGFLFLIGKVKFVKDALDKVGGVVGLSEKKYKEPEIPETSSSEQKTAEPGATKSGWSERTEKSDLKKERKPATSFADAAIKSQDKEMAASIG